MLKLTDILGQVSAVDRLRRAMLADRLPHGMIFAGPVGVGKATTATALAGTFLCENPRDALPCGQCESCRAMAAGIHPDFHVITKEMIRLHDKTGKTMGTTMSINVIRAELVAKAALTSVMGRGKVFIIEQAELMLPDAQNAMLKILEEPASRTLIILLTDLPNYLLQTVRSRSQIVQFAPLADEIVIDQLKHRGIDTVMARNAARFAQGSLGLALRWIEDDVISHAVELVAMFDSLLAGHRAPDLPAWFKKAADEYADKQLEHDELTSKSHAQRNGLNLYLHIAAEHIRPILAGDDTDQAIWVANAIDAIVQSEDYLDSNVNTSLVFQQLSVALERTGQSV
jgi:DNA polymerase-3 subunit delta'